MPHRLKYLEQEVEFLKKYPLPEVRESKGRGHERGFHHFFLIHQTLSSSENEFSVSMMCQAAGISRSGYYAWLKAASARQTRETQDRTDFELVLETYNRRWYSKKGREASTCA